MTANFKEDDVGSLDFWLQYEVFIEGQVFQFEDKRVLARFLDKFALVVLPGGQVGAQLFSELGCQFWLA